MCLNYSTGDALPIRVRKRFAPSKRVAIFDIESVLIDAEFLPLVAKLVGKWNLVNDITMKGIRGEIGWEEGLRRRVETIKGTRYEDVVGIADAMPYMEGAKELCKELKEKGYVLIGITGGFSVLADRVEKELDLDYAFSNELVFEHGALRGVKRLKVTSERIEGLRATLKRIGAKRENTVAVVDGANDMKMFEHAGLRIAFNAQPIVRQHADIVVDTKDLREILKYL